MRRFSRLRSGLGKAWYRGRHLSGTGLALGTLCFAASLTPSLVPRTFTTQGVLAGTCFAIGYGLGVFWRNLWTFLELPEPGSQARRIGTALVGGACLFAALACLWHATAWQNSIRERMGLETLTTTEPVWVCLVALPTAVLWFVLAGSCNAIRRRAVIHARRLVPWKVALVAGTLGTVVLLWLTANLLLFRLAFRALDSSYQQYDGLFEPERSQPTAWGKTGSPSSLVRWPELGRAGREFVASGPSASDIGALTGRPAQEPIRVYVGMRSAETAEARAQLALSELLRVHAFERSALVVITPTGTGWVDPAAMEAAEYLHHGDIASVAVQYSYLSSPLSLMMQPEYGSSTARRLFGEIYGYWANLPKEHRPKLYVHGLSLGAMNSERAIDFFDMIEEPITGALWSGPPFGSRMWRMLTDNRDPGSPAWLPRFRTGRLVRFQNQIGPSVPSDAPWGPLRVVYLQYASDPVTFFDYRDFFRAPAWLQPSRGPDVSPELRWYPLVTGLQLGVDMALGTTTPTGYGHVYAPAHYVDAWVEVADVHDWSAVALDRLKQELTARMARGGDRRDQPYVNRGG